ALRILARPPRTGQGASLDLGLLCRHGLGNIDEGAGGIRRSIDHCSLVSRCHSAMAELLEERRASLRHVALPYAGRPLVCSHVPPPWRCVLLSSESPHGGTIPRSNGGTWRGLVVLFPCFAVGLLPLERVPTGRALSRLSELAGIPHGRRPQARI